MRVVIIEEDESGITKSNLDLGSIKNGNALKARDSSTLIETIRLPIDQCIRTEHGPSNTRRKKIIHLHCITSPLQHFYGFMRDP